MMTSSLQEHRLDVPEDDESAHRHHHHRDPSTKKDVELETPKNSKKSDGDPSSRAVFFGKALSTSQRTKAFGRSSQDSGTGSNGSGNVRKRLSSATSAALLRVKGVGVRSGSSGQVLNPRSVTRLNSRSLSPLPSPRIARDSGGDDDDSASSRSSVQILSPPDGRTKKASDAHTQEHTSSSSSGSRSSASARKSDAPPSIDVGILHGGDKTKLSALFEEDGSSGEETDDDGKSNIGSRITATNGDHGHAATPRTGWASTLMTSTLAREKSTRKPTPGGGGVGLLPHPQDVGNKVRCYYDYVCPPTI